MSTRGTRGGGRDRAMEVLGLGLRLLDTNLMRKFGRLQLHLWLRKGLKVEGIARVSPNVVEYWMEATERIMDDLDCTPDQKIKVAIEYEWCVQFEDGLKDGLKVLIAPQRERDFTALVDKAKIVEDVTRVERQNKENGKGRRDFCADCGKRHQGECWRKLDVCMRCGSLEHQVKDCLRRPDQMQATSMGIACSVFEKFGILVENTLSGITVLSTLGQFVRVNRMFRDVPLEIQGIVFLADLIELFFREFELILGIDWLVKYRVSLDCATKRVVLRTAIDEEVVVIGERRNYLSNLITALRAEKLVHNGCKAFFAYVSVSEVGDSLVKDIRTVKDFLDVFPEELLGLPPEREVEFGIELLSGIAPVSIAPYRMPSKELVELKAQIQELLDHGFIRPSVSL
ncbi:uncharacterized protein [Gossypium hirsutum]|uniref:DNA/RNA polymerases superfamily protein n=1 Tax=Gossypium hirsutum TaxID=3635 RepID=A0A1U8IEF8_GOSHI|nr:uncharacterized protein LOC107895877 [Gossypium hirsutum]